jgi:phytoene synthase
MSTVVHHPLQLDTAYGVCGHIARSHAKNFYYGFALLPRRKRNALSAVYAFMRHADDISDDATLSVADRRTRLADFLDRYHRVAEGAPTDDPVFLALRDSQYRYEIPTELLDSLVRGTGMDLPHSDGEAQAGSPLVYETFDQLYEYCYHVAAVVGLVCIRIFGYKDPAAEPLAEHVGVAFQLTNILRDIKEDAAMNRVYLPEEDLRRFGLSAGELLRGENLASFRPVLELEAQRAREFYRAADELIPLIDEVSQPALWALVEIYRSLLDKITARNYDVFSERVHLTRREKFKILARGAVRRVL